MHVELPKAKKFKEFSGEYLMIVISIVTALGLEHAVQSYHHRHEAHEATVKIEAELRADLDDIGKSLDHNNKERERTAKLFREFLDELRRGEHEQTAIDHLLEKDRNALSVSVSAPTMQREAWDVAVANQSASWIEPDQLGQYAALYAHMRDVDAIGNGGSNRFFDGPQLVNAGADLQLGRARAQDVLRALSQIVSAYDSMDGNLQHLRDDFAKRLEGSTHGG